MQTSNINFYRIEESINKQSLPIRVSRIEDIMVLEKEGIPFPINMEWTDDTFKQTQTDQGEDVADLLVENYSLLHDYLKETEMVDISWAITSEIFMQSRNFEALCATQIHVEQLRNPVDYGWINFVILAERNERKDLAIKTARTALEKFPSAIYNALLIFEVAQFGNLDEIPELIKNIKSFKMPEKYDDEKRTLYYLNDASWCLLQKGAFQQAEQLLDMHLDIHEAFHPLINKGHACLLQGNQATAMVFYQKAMEKSDNFFRDFDDDRSVLASVIDDDASWQSVRDDLEKI